MDRRRFLAVFGGVALLPLLPRPAWALSQSSVLEATQQSIGGVGLKGEEVIRVAGVEAYGGDLKGFHYHVNGAWVGAPAGSFLVAPGDTITWVGVNAERQETGTIASFTIPSPPTVPVAPSPSPQQEPQPEFGEAVPTPQPESEPEPEQAPPAFEERIQKLFAPWTVFVWRGEDGTPLEKEVARVSPESVIQGVFSWREGKIVRYTPRAPAFAQTLSELNDGDIVLVRSSAPGTWVLKVPTGP